MLSTSLFSQETRYLGSKYYLPIEYEQTGKTILVNSPTTIKPLPVGVFEVETSASVVNLLVSDKQRNPVSFELTEKVDTEDGKVKYSYLIFGQGRIWITVTCVNADPFLFEQKQEILDVATPEPEPDDPDPDPDDPDPDDGDDDKAGPDDDRFDNIGKKIFGWSKDLPANAKLGEIYDEYAKKIRTSPQTIGMINTSLVKDLAAVNGYDKYKDLFQKLAEDSKSRWDGVTLNKVDISDYWAAIAKGFQAWQN